MRQVQLARALDISKQYLSEIESGKKAVSVKMLKKYAEVFSVPASSILMLAENLDAVKRRGCFRLKCATKIVKVMNWVGDQKIIVDKTSKGG